jgi:hypothetical protein
MVKRSKFSCPDCGKPLRKGEHAKHFCENDSCLVIYVRFPDKESITEIVRQPKAR